MIKLLTHTLANTRNNTPYHISFPTKQINKQYTIKIKNKRYKIKINSKNIKNLLDFYTTHTHIANKKEPLQNDFSNLIHTTANITTNPNKTKAIIKKLGAKHFINLANTIKDSNYQILNALNSTTNPNLANFDYNQKANTTQTNPNTSDLFPAQPGQKSPELSRNDPHWEGSMSHDDPSRDVGVRGTGVMDVLSVDPISKFRKFRRPGLSRE